jgi:HD-like signal output (HDOD) protein
MGGPSANSENSGQEKAIAFLTQHGDSFKNPVLIRETLAVLRDPTCSAQNLVSILEKEPGLSSRVLKAANSALFGMPKSIASLKAAVVRLGNQNVARLALAAGLTPAPSLHWAGYWRHSVGVAALCRHMAAFTGDYDSTEQDEFFSMGLLHDLGVLVEIASGEFDLAVNSLAEYPTLEHAEKQTWGFGHADLGLLLAERWNFPGDLRAAIAWHHSPLEAGDYQRPALIVHLADLVAHGFGLAIHASEGPPPTEEAYLTEAKLPVEQLVFFGEWLQTQRESIDSLGSALAGS